MLLITNDAIIALLLPDRPCCLSSLVDFSGHVSLANLKDILKLIVWKRLDDQVAMVRHHRETRCKAALVLEVDQSISKELGKRRFLEAAATGSLVQPSFGLDRNCPREMRLLA
jgi:hypothetical protein